MAVYSIRKRGKPFIFNVANLCSHNPGLTLLCHCKVIIIICTSLDSHRSLSLYFNSQLWFKYNILCCQFYTVEGGIAWNENSNNLNRLLAQAWIYSDLEISAEPWLWWLNLSLNTANCTVQKLKFDYDIVFIISSISWSSVLCSSLVLLYTPKGYMAYQTHSKIHTCWAIFVPTVLRLVLSCSSTQ